MKNKTCNKCGNTYPATTVYFYERKDRPSSLRSPCKKCRAKSQKNYSHTKEGKRSNRKGQKNYRQTLNGYLREVYYAIRRRCNKPHCRMYRYYGGRGIECRFECFVDFFSCVVTDLGITKLNQIKGLQIDRIDNDRHYEPGNIRFVTAKVNCNNRGNSKLYQ